MDSQKKSDGSEERKKDVLKKKSPNVDNSRVSSIEEKDRSKKQRSSSAISTTKSENNSVVEKTADTVKEPTGKKIKFPRPGIQPNVVAVIISFVLQLIVAFYILALLLTAQGVNIIYLIVCLLMNITAVFFTAEVSISNEKYFVLLSLVDSLLVCGGAIVILVLLIKFSEMEVTGVLHIAAVTIVVQVCHVFALAHHCYVKYLRKDKGETEEAPHCSCRQAAGCLPDSEDPPRSPSPVKRSPPQSFYTEDCGHTPVSKQTTPPTSSKVNAETERSSVKTKVTWYDTIEIATTPKGSRPMRYLVEV